VAPREAGPPAPVAGLSLVGDQGQHAHQATVTFGHGPQRTVLWPDRSLVAPSANFYELIYTKPNIGAIMTEDLTCNGCVAGRKRAFESGIVVRHVGHWATAGQSLGWPDDREITSVR